MKKFSFLLSVILVFCLAFLTSCSSIFDSSSGGATVSFRLNQDAVNALASKISSSRAGVPAELEGTTLSVTLYVNNKPVTQEAPLTQNGVLITFPHIIVGSKVSAFVQVKKGADLLAAGTSSETIRVKKGENLLSVTLRYAADGQLFFGDHVTIQLVASNASNEVWLNKGDWTIKLLDDNGNDILADVDWEARDPSTPNNSLYNEYIIHIEPSVRKGHTAFDGNYFSINGNKLSMNQDYPLPESGTMEFILTIMPGAETYMSKSGKLKPFPQFEPVSTTIEMNVSNNICFDVTGINYFNSNGNDYNSKLHDVLTSLSEDTLIKLYGTTDSDFISVFGCLVDGRPSSVVTENDDIPFEISIDISELSSTDTFKATASYCCQDFYNLVSLVLPENDTLTRLGKGTFQKCTHLRSITIGSYCYSLCQSLFENCWSLESIVIPAAVTEIEFDAFKGCSALTDIIFENPNGWYSSSELISGTIDWNSLTPVDFSTTEQRLQLVDQNGLGAKYLYRKTE